MTASNGWSLRELYRPLETPGANRLRDAHAAYGMKDEEDPLAFLLRLNLELADKEAKGQALIALALPFAVAGSPPVIGSDCIQASG